MAPQGGLSMVTLCGEAGTRLRSMTIAAASPAPTWARPAGWQERIDTAIFRARAKTTLTGWGGVPW